MTVTGLLFAGILRQSLSFYEGTAAAVPPAGLFNSIRRGPARFPPASRKPRFGIVEISLDYTNQSV